jgi:hypothetical protein
MISSPPLKEGNSNLLYTPPQCLKNSNEKFFTGEIPIMGEISDVSGFQDALRVAKEGLETSEAELRAAIAPLLTRQLEAGDAMMMIDPILAEGFNKSDTDLNFVFFLSFT